MLLALLRLTAEWAQNQLKANKKRTNSGWHELCDVYDEGKRPRARTYKQFEIASSPWLRFLGWFFCCKRSSTWWMQWYSHYGTQTKSLFCHQSSKQTSNINGSKLFFTFSVCLLDVLQVSVTQNFPDPDYRLCNRRTIIKQQRITHKTKRKVTFPLVCSSRCLPMVRFRIKLVAGINCFYPAFVFNFT